MLKELETQVNSLEQENKYKQSISLQLTSEINSKKRELDSLYKKYDIEVKRLQDNFLEELKDVQDKINQEDFDIVKLTQDQLEIKVKELESQEIRVHKLESLLEERKKILDNKDLEIAKLTTDLQSLWSKLWDKSYNNIKAKLKSLETREQTQSLIEKENQDKRKILNDRIRSFRQAEKDLLEKQNG